MSFRYKASRYKASLSLALLTLSGTAALPVHAQINGFGSGSGFTLNGNGVTPTISGGTFQATDGKGSEASSVFYSTKQDITDWTAGFTYQDVTGGGADGVTFMLQNVGLNALGVGGGHLGYSGVTPSAAVAFNIYAPYGKGTKFLTGGADPQSTGYTPTGTVDLASGDAIAVQLHYNGTTLFEQLTDATAGTSYATSYKTDLASVLGGTSAYVGFSGADGSGTSVQQISKFQFSPVPEASSVVSFGLLLMLGLGGAAWSARRRRANSAV